MPEDPYSDPVTGVLHNKLGLGAAAGLEAAEREITHAALILLDESPVSPKCRHDHRLKQHPKWKVDQLPDGTFRAGPPQPGGPTPPNPPDTRSSSPQVLTGGVIRLAGPGSATRG